MAKVKDLIIGAAVGYTWDDLKYWINSIRKTDFDGDVVLVGTNLKSETINRLTNEGVILNLYGIRKENGDVDSPTNNAPHVERFFYLWEYLRSTKEFYRYVITTDTRDVVFQRNPVKWLESNLQMYPFVCGSEGLRYKNEPWGNQNLHDAFGPYFHNLLKDEYIYNVGVLAGKFSHMKGLLSFIFHMSVIRPIPVVDQAVFNMIINTEPWKLDTYFVTMEDDWTVHLGTTIEAVKAGSGDLGKTLGDNPTNLLKYQLSYEDKQPVIDENGIVYNERKMPYTIVHQYDRILFLKNQIEKLYGDDDAKPGTIFHHSI